MHTQLCHSRWVYFSIRFYKHVFGGFELNSNLFSRVKIYEIRVSRLMKDLATLRREER